MKNISVILLTLVIFAYGSSSIAEQVFTAPDVKFENVAVGSLTMEIINKFNTPIPEGSGMRWPQLADGIAQDREALKKKQALMVEMEDKMKIAVSDLKGASQRLDKLVVGKQAEDEDLRLIVTMYETIDPKKAAGLLKKLDREMVLAVVRMMSPKKASKVLSEMDDTIAAQLSKMLVERPKGEKGQQEASL